MMKIIPERLFNGDGSQQALSKGDVMAHKIEISRETNPDYRAFQQMGSSGNSVVAAFCAISEALVKISDQLYEIETRLEKLEEKN